MGAIKKLAAADLVGVSVAVAVFFIINIFLLDAVSVSSVWYVMDTMLPIILGVTGCRLWRESSRS